MFSPFRAPGAFKKNFPGERSELVISESKFPGGGNGFLLFFYKLIYHKIIMKESLWSKLPYNLQKNILDIKQNLEIQEIYNTLIKPPTNRALAQTKSGLKRYLGINKENNFFEDVYDMVLGLTYLDESVRRANLVRFNRRYNQTNDNKVIKAKDLLRILARKIPPKTFSNSNNNNNTPPTGNGYRRQVLNNNETSVRQALRLPRKNVDEYVRSRFNVKTYPRVGFSGK